MNWAFSVSKAAISSNHSDWLDSLTNQLGVDPKPETCGFDLRHLPFFRASESVVTSSLTYKTNGSCLVLQRTGSWIKNWMSCRLTSF